MRGDQIPLGQQSWALGDIYYSVCEMSNPNYRKLILPHLEKLTISKHQ